MFDFLKKDNSSPSYVGIDIGSSTMKVVELRKEKEKLILNTYGELELGPYAGQEVGMAVRLGEEKLKEALRDLLREAKVNSSHYFISLPTANCFLSTINLPNLPPEQLKTMVPIEARKYLPMKIEEMHIDWWPYPKTNNDIHSIEIVLLAVKNEIIESYKRLSNILEMTPLLEIEGFSQNRSVSNYDAGEKLIIDFGASTTKLVFVSGQIIKKINIINRGSEMITRAIASSLSLSFKTAEEVKREFGYIGDPSNKLVKEIIDTTSYPLFEELERLVIAEMRKYNVKIGSVYAVGGGAMIKGLEDKLKEIFKEEKVFIANPFQNIEQPEFLRPMLALIGPSYATAIGLAQRELKQ